MFDAVRRVVHDAIGRRVFPAAVVEVGESSRMIWSEAFGRLTYDVDASAAEVDSIFDLASLTKVLATTPLVMRQVERGSLGLDDLVGRHVSDWRGAGREDVRLRDLLAHCSGLPAVRPYFETLSGSEAFERSICFEPLAYPARTASTYSDLGFILLGVILGRTLDLAAQVATLLADMNVVDPLQFKPPQAWRRRIAPTAYDSWRKRLLVGEVDDNNAAALGGVAGHAGLFGTAAAVGACARHLLQVLDGRQGAFGTDTARLFVSRCTDVQGSSRALGWDTMLPTSSCGTHLSAHAFGHTGFTGTSLWVDPIRDRYVVLLSNRVHPDRSDRGIREVRRAVHDAVMSERSY